jgi:DNA modification methylase
MAEQKWRNRIVGHSEVDPKTLVPNPLNWRLHPKGQKDAMQGALDDIGWVQEITINKNTGRVVDGHLRLDLALQNNEPFVPVKIVDLTEAEEAAVLATLDPISAMAKTDKANLAAILDMTNSQNDKMRQLLESMKMKAGQLPRQDRPDYKYDKVETSIVEGDLFDLNGHRVMCGSSLNEEHVSKLMGEEIASIVFTSPPYNAGHTPTETKYGKDGKYKDHDDNVDQSEYRDFLKTYLETWLPKAVYTFTNIQLLAGNKLAVVEWLYDTRHHLADQIVWDKMSAPPAMADNVLDSRFEMIYIHKDETPCSRKIGTKKFRGVVPNVYAAPVQRSNEFAGQHNATFPLHFPIWGITTFTNVGEVVADPFLGVGTTLIACEENERKCYGMELSPEYCELSIQRWEKQTGKQRVKANG